VVLGMSLTESERPLRALPRRSGAGRIATGVLNRYVTVVLLAAVILGFSLATSNFLTVANWQSLLLQQAVVGTMALAVLMPLIIGEFDLSVGYLLGFLAMAGAYVAGHGGGTAEILVTMIGGGILVGLINGILTVVLKISSFIATLGTGILLSGFTLGVSNGHVLFAGIPSSIAWLGAGKIAGLAASVWLTLLIAIVLFYVLEHTPLGRFWYAIGGSERVAFLAGVRTNAMRILVFPAAGLLIGVAAVFQLGQAGAANPGGGVDLLLPAYAAAFLGVTTFRPGYYNVVGTVVAIVLVAAGFNGLSLLGVPFWVQPIFNGSVLLIAVLTARAEARHVRVGG
jgi:ribose transport system permease protein